MEWWEEIPEEPLTCIYCGCELPDALNDPYCSWICELDAEAEDRCEPRST